MTLVQHLVRVLPPGYTAAPNVHIGAPEVDVATYEQDVPESLTRNGGGGTATLRWAPPVPTFRAEADPLDVGDFAVRVFVVGSR